MTFDEFAETRLDALLRFAKALCVDRAMAEDVVQNVLTRAMARWSEIEGMAYPQAYVRKMIVNEFLSWQRGRWARVFLTSDVPVSRRQHTVADHAEAIADHDALVSELRRLPRRQRTVIVLRYFVDLSDHEIGEELGCSVETVRSHASRALQALRIRCSNDSIAHTGA